MVSWNILRPFWCFFFFMNFCKQLSKYFSWGSYNSLQDSSRNAFCEFSCRSFWVFYKNSYLDPSWNLFCDFFLEFLLDLIKVFVLQFVLSFFFSNVGSWVPSRNCPGNFISCGYHNLQGVFYKVSLGLFFPAVLLEIFFSYILGSHLIVLWDFFRSSFSAGEWHFLC